MDLKSEALAEIEGTRKFFERTTSVFEEADSGFRATPETMSIAAMVAHVAQTIDWFREGGFEDRWRTDFAEMTAATDRVESLGVARKWLDEAWERLRAAVAAMPEAKLEQSIRPNPILPERPRYYVIEGLVDHTAHHRGSLAVFARLLGRLPPMPYS
jgi:uncharacterized damage-inducible protein DinB